MNNKEYTVNGFVVRNATGKLFLFSYKPTRRPESLMTDEELKEQGKSRVHYPRQWNYPSNGLSFNELWFPKDVFSEVKWEDEPVEVELTIKTKEK